MSNVSRKSLLLSLVVVSAVSLASSVTLPHNFVAGTPARAAEVNANFAAVKSAVDDNHTRLQRLETVESFTAPTLNAPWVELGMPWTAVGFMKDPFGFVHVRGVIRRPTAGPNQIFTLPSGYRPSRWGQFPTRCGDGNIGLVTIFDTGVVEFTALTATCDPTQSVTLDRITFDVR